MKDILELVRLISAPLAMAVALLVSSPALAQEPCFAGDECSTGFCVDGVCCDRACDGPCEGCSTIVKGEGEDGVCAQAAVGHVCGEEPSCDGSSFSFVPGDTCDDNGVCVQGGPPESCFQSDGVCAFDLCHDTNGCEVVKAQDGMECGTDMACFDGVCGDSTSAGAGGGGNGAGGEGQGGEVETASTGTGFGGQGGVVQGGSTEVNTTCSCRTAGEPSDGRAPLLSGLVLAMFAYGRRRRLSPKL